MANKSSWTKFLTGVKNNLIKIIVAATGSIIVGVFMYHYKIWDEKKSANVITPTKYTITYHQDGGIGAIDTTYTNNNDLISLPTSSLMTKEGFRFAGWYNNSSFKGETVTNIPSGSSGNKEFWAKWKKIVESEIELTEDERIEKIEKLLDEARNSSDMSNVKLTLYMKAYGLLKEKQKDKNFIRDIQNESIETRINRLNEFFKSRNF